MSDSEQQRTKQLMQDLLRLTREDEEMVRTIARTNAFGSTDCVQVVRGLVVSQLHLLRSAGAFNAPSSAKRRTE